MEENQKSTELLSKLALITEGAQEVIKGKVSIIFEVNRQEFYLVFKKNLNKYYPLATYSFVRVSTLTISP